MFIFIMLHHTTFDNVENYDKIIVIIINKEREVCLRQKCDIQNKEKSFTKF